MENNLDLEKESAQMRFDKNYITSAEIMQRLDISRSAILYARKTGKLPGAIEVQPGVLYIWEREKVEPYIGAWKMLLDARRGETLNGA
jgi:predicted DNA-binding transcriptional regulator AlpA